MFIPLKDLNPRRHYPIVNTTLILVNVLVFLYQYSLPPHTFKLFMTTYATIPARFPAWLSGHAPLESAFVPLLTSMFLHSGVLHIAGNMLFLWIFGDNVEDFYGHFTYLFFYLFCGIGSGLLHVAFKHELSGSSPGSQRSNFRSNGRLPYPLPALANPDSGLCFPRADSRGDNPRPLVHHAVRVGVQLARFRSHPAAWHGGPT